MKFVLCMLHTVTVVSQYYQQNCTCLSSLLQCSNIITIHVNNNKWFMMMYLPEYTSLCTETVNIKPLFHSYLWENSRWRESILCDSAPWWLQLRLGSNSLKSQPLPATGKSVLNESLCGMTFLTLPGQVCLSYKYIIMIK